LAWAKKPSVPHIKVQEVHFSIYLEAVTMPIRILLPNQCEADKTKQLYISGALFIAGHPTNGRLACQNLGSQLRIQEWHGTLNCR